MKYLQHSNINSIKHRQSGVALFTVLILLVVLAVASTALIQLQRNVVKQMSDRLDVLDQNAISSVAHDVCVQKMRQGIEGTASIEALTGYSGGDGFIGADDARWSNHADGCIFEWYQSSNNSTVPWMPHIRVTSRVDVAGQKVLEISEWRYPECVQGQACLGQQVKQIDERGKGFERILNTQYGSGTIATARQRL